MRVVNKRTIASRQEEERQRLADVLFLMTDLLTAAERGDYQAATHASSQLAREGIEVRFIAPLMPTGRHGR